MSANNDGAKRSLDTIPDTITRLAGTPLKADRVSVASLLNSGTPTASALSHELLRAAVRGVAQLAACLAG